MKTNRFSPYGPEPYQSIGQVRRRVSDFLLKELILWLIQSEQIDPSQRPGQQTLSHSRAQIRGP